LFGLVFVDVHFARSGGLWFAASISEGMQLASRAQISNGFL
jgi:hypothetical protein